jgi:microcystin-dependent protein
MPWNGSGTFNRIYSWVADKAAGLDISSTRMDTDTNDIASSGFGNCLTRDGQGQPTMNLPMAGFRHTGVGNGVAVSDYAALGQAQNGLLNWTVAGGTSDAITATYTPSITALSDGQILAFRATAANLTTTPTFAPNGLTARTITKNGGQALAIGDIPGNLAEVALRYNVANTRWELLNPPDIPIGGLVPFFGGTVPSGFALPQGQNLAAATYPAANAVLGTTYGNPGGGNFTMPDLRGRAIANLDAGGSNRITVAGGNFDGTVLGNTGGSQNRTASTTLAQANLPNVNFNVSGIALTNGASTLNTNVSTAAPSAAFTGICVGGVTNANVSWNGGGGLNINFNLNTNVSVASQGTAASGGSGTAATSAAFSTLPPIMTINCMMRIA